MIAEHFFCEVLHAHIECGHHVATVFGSCVHNINIAVRHLFAVTYARASAQFGIKSQFQSTQRRIIVRTEFTHRACRQISVRIFAAAELFVAKSPHSDRKAEERQFLQLQKLEMRDAFLRVERDVVFLFAASLDDATAKCLGIQIGNNLMHPVHDAVHAVGQNRVAALLVFFSFDRIPFPRHRIQKNAIFRQGSGQQLAVGRENVATSSRERFVFALELCVHSQPIVTIHRHQVGRLEQNDQSKESKEETNELIASQHSSGVVFWLFVVHIVRI